MIPLRKPLLIGAVFLEIQMTWPWILGPSHGFMRSGRIVFLLPVTFILIGYVVVAHVFRPDDHGNLFLGIIARERFVRVTTLIAWASGALMVNRFALSRLEPPAVDTFPTAPSLLEMT